MSEIRFSRSVPAPWMVRANSTCLSVRLPSGLSLQLLAEDQDRVQRRAQLVGHVGQELGLVLRGQRQLGRPSPPARGGPARSPGSCAPPRRSARPAAAPSAPAARWSAAARFCCVCSSAASCCDCVSRPSVCIVASMRVEHDADAGGQLLEERQLQVGEGVERRQLDHRLDLTLEQHRQHDHVARLAPGTGPSGSARRCGGRSVEHHAPRVARALADQALAQPQLRADGPRSDGRRRRPAAAACRRRRLRSRTW